MHPPRKEKPPQQAYKIAHDGALAEEVLRAYCYSPRPGRDRHREGHIGGLGAMFQD